MQRVLASCLNYEQVWKPRPDETLILPETTWEEPWGRELGVKSNLGFVSCTQFEQRRTVGARDDGLGSHRVAIVTDQSFMILYPSRANVTLDNETLGVSAPRVVNAIDEFIDRQLRDYELHAERWLKQHSGVAENDVVVLAINLAEGKQYDFDLFGCSFSVIARPGKKQAVFMKGHTDTRASGATK